MASNDTHVQDAARSALLTENPEDIHVGSEREVLVAAVGSKTSRDQGW